MNQDEFNQIMQRVSQLSVELRRNSGYLARKEIEGLKSEYRNNPKRLEQFGYKVYSQNDEDGILSEIFKRIGVEHGVFCEIGVENGLECNSLYLIHKGWRGIWLEGNEGQKQSIESKFELLIQSKKLALGIAYIKPENINVIITERCSALEIDASQIDFLSIDIDGMDIYLLEAIEFKPKVICMEYNSKFPPSLNKKPLYDPSFRWNFSDYMGSSLVALDESAKRLGYSLVGTNLTGANAFFVRNDLLGNHFNKELTPEALYNPCRYYLFFDHYHDTVGHYPDFGPYVDLM